MINPYQSPNKVSEIENAIARRSSAAPYLFALYGLVTLCFMAFFQALGLALKDIVGPEPPETGYYFLSSAMLGLITEILGFFFFARRHALGATIMSQIFAGVAMLIAAFPLWVIIQGVLQELLF